MKRKINSGVLTFECALIMPLVLAVNVILVWMLIFCYDRVVTEKAMVHSLLVCDYSRENNNKLKKEIEKAAEEELKGALVGVKETNINVTVGMNKCSVTVCNEMNIPTCLQAYFGTYEAKLEKNRRSGEKTIRNIRKVLKFTEKIQEQSKEQSEESVKELPE